MAKDTISILDGSTFLVSGPSGDIDASPDPDASSAVKEVLA
jgi:hypothetical protein